jgi:hypothetical protein
LTGARNLKQETATASLEMNETMVNENRKFAKKQLRA